MSIIRKCSLSRLLFSGTVCICIYVFFVPFVFPFGPMLSTVYPIAATPAADELRKRNGRPIRSFSQEYS